jgi:phage I-like protein
MTYAALTFALAGASEIQLTPSGPAFRADDGSGRPADVAAWRIDRGIAEQIKARHAARKNPIVIDYEHQSLSAEKNGQPAPAAGWFRDLEWREGQGLFATGVEWTEKAAAMIAAKEYRYVSPVFYYDRPGGAVRSIRMAALTNDPGLDGMRAVALSARLSQLSPNEEDTMNELLKKLRAALGLADDQTEDEALAALAALKAKADGADAEIAALKAKAPETAPDPAKYVPVAVVSELQNQVAALKAAQDKSAVDALFKEAREADKLISPEYEAHLRTIPVAALKGVLDGLAPIAALKGMQSDTPGVGKDGKPLPTGAELAVMKALGLTAEEFAKGGA